jgi:hypothetical protein
MIELAVANNIDLFLLLAHTTHMCQPLDVGVFGPGQKAWAQQCDLHLAETGRPMRKEDVVGAYMKARDKAFSEGTIISAWIKCGIRPSADGVSGVDAFKPEQFAPSNNTSTHIHLPETYPTEPPSDFDPWPTPDNELEESVGQLTMDEFWQMWKAEDGTAECGNQMSGESSTESDDDDEDDLAEGEERWGRPLHDSHPMMVVDGQEQEPSTSTLSRPLGMSLSDSCDQHVVSELIPQPTIVRNGGNTTTNRMPANRSSTATTSPISPMHDRLPIRCPESLAQTKRLNKMLQPPSKLTTKTGLGNLVQKMAEEIALLRSQRNDYKTHALFAHQELDKAQQKANSKKRKKGPAVRIDNGELLTSSEARERRAARSAELQEKHDAKAAKDAKKAEKEKAEETRRTAAIRDTTITFTGSIATKNKADLQVILATLGLLGMGTNVILKERLVQHFEANPSDKALPRYAGLFTRGRTRPHASITTPLSPPSENTPPSMLPLLANPPPSLLAGPSRTAPRSPQHYHPYYPPQIYTPFAPS